MPSTTTTTFTIIFKLWQNIHFFYSRRRLEMEPEQQQNFWRNVQCIVEKDVVRTDRSNPYFAGEDNPNIDVMK